METQRVLSPTDVNNFHAALTSTLSDLGAKLGLEVKPRGTIRYDTTQIRCAVTASIPGVETERERDYNFIRGSYGLPKLGTKFIENGNVYEIVGWKSKARKNKVEIRNAAGVTYVAPVSFVKRHLAEGGA